MNRIQEKTGEGRNTLPVKGTPTDMDTSADASLGNIASVGFDNLPTQAGLACGQYGSGGAVPIVAPADAVQPAAGEVQL